MYILFVQCTCENRQPGAKKAQTAADDIHPAASPQDSLPRLKTQPETSGKEVGDEVDDRVEALTGDAGKIEGEAGQ